MNDKMKNLAVRSLSGVVLAAVVLGAVILSPWSFGVLLLLLLVLGMREFYALAEARGARPQRVLGIALGAALFVLAFLLTVPTPAWRSILAQSGVWLFSAVLLLLLAVPAMLICELYRKNPDPAGAIGATLLGIGYAALPLSCLCIMTSNFFAGAQPAQAWSPWAVLFYIFIIWANDVFAYLVGMSVGRHPLFPRLSPKKSWEGFVGGLAGAAAVGAIAAQVLDGNRAAWVGLALVAAATGVLGDLAESMFKRSAGVKDSGTLIPGHGGVLDRFDAVLLSAPFAVIYMVFCRVAFGVGF
ncbi:MAG: phosphatidate cytidylyltransferase [Alistipes sp.]|nr:phosphatidate cytidylyltransferase [Alistipes sp.]